jgi:hypothetical protein
MCSEVTSTLLRIGLVIAGQEDGEARILPVTERELVPNMWTKVIVANKRKVHRDRMVDGKYSRVAVRVTSWKRRMLSLLTLLMSLS